MSYAIPVATRFDRRVSTVRDLLGDLSALLALAVSAVLKARTARREQRLLMELPDYLLIDVGIERADIPRAIRHGRI